MIAAILHGPGDVRLEELPDPEPPDAAAAARGREDRLVRAAGLAPAPARTGATSGTQSFTW